MFFTTLATGSLVLELVAPLVLADRRLAQAWAAGAFAMHWGIKAVMGITFRHNLSGVVYQPYFEMEKLFEAINPRTSAIRSGRVGALAA